MRAGAAALLVLVAALPSEPRAAADAPHPSDAGAAPAATDLAGLGLRELALAEALPLARHGYVFRTTWLDRYFRAQPWYRPTGFDARELPADERASADAAARYRAALPKADLWRRREALHGRQRAARERCPRGVVAGGTRLVVKDQSGLVLWDVATGQELRVATNTQGLMTSPAPAISPDGARVLAVEAEGTFGRKVSSWNGATGKSFGKPLLQAWDESILYLLAPDGASAFVHRLSDPRSAELYALDEHRSLLTLSVDGLTMGAERVSPSADRRTVLALSGGRPWLWRSKGGPPGPPVPLTEQYDSVDEADLSPDGRWVAVVGSSSSGVRLIDVERPEKPKYLEGPPGSRHFVSFSPDGRLVLAGTLDHGLAIWDVAGRRLVWSRPGSKPSLDCARRWAAFLPGGGEVAMVDDGGGVRLLDIRTRAERALGPAGTVSDPEANLVEEALIDRALGQTPSGDLLAELSFERQPDLFKQPLEEEALPRHVKEGHDLRELEALIYARHGRRFASPRWGEFAKNLDWYHPDATYGPARLTPVDRANLALLIKTERQLEPRSPRGRPDKASQVPERAFPGCPADAKRKQSTDEGGGLTIFCVKPAAGGEISHGPSWRWLPTGRLGETHAFVDGKEQGPTVTWFWTGVRKEEGQLASGQRQGRWRTYHPNGKLADESTFEGGKLQGPRRRFFENGKPALEASYERGAPVGPWTAHYNNGRRALAVTFPATPAPQSAGWLPDGKRWPAREKIQSCEGRRKCGSPLEHVDLDSLPPVIPDPSCPSSGNVPPGSWKPILSVVRAGWGDDSDYRPSQCIGQVTITCAPDLDGTAGAEVLARIDYRILLNSQQNCRTKESNDVWEMGALVALSPPGPGRTSWAWRGLIGFPNSQADNGGADTTVLRFVRLPSGEAALHTSEDSGPAGDCGAWTDESIMVLRDGKWVDVARRTIHACDRPDEPEEWDVF